MTLVDIVTLIQGLKIFFTCFNVQVVKIYTYGKKIKVFIIIYFLFCGLHKLRKLHTFWYLYYYCDHVAEIFLHFCDAKIHDTLIAFVTKNICSWKFRYTIPNYILLFILYFISFIIYYTIPRLSFILINTKQHVLCVFFLVTL